MLGPMAPSMESGAQARALRAAIHDVSPGRGNVDHVVVGPGGVFTIETKSHRGRIRVDRIDGAMLKQAYAQKKLLERVTGLEVEPLLVFTQAWLLPRRCADRIR
jgi:hypothetical protein